MRSLIEKFYTCFQSRDWTGMQACYHPDAIFSDPVFQNLSAKEVKAMWHMLVSSGRDLRIEFSEVSAQGDSGSCKWEAWYSFSRTGRKVHNVIHAEFKFRDGKIISHADSFDLTRWSGMALGLVGKLLGWTPYVRNQIRKTATGSLRKFIKEHPEYR